MATIVHFDVPAENIERAQEFYGRVFDWNFVLDKACEYYLFETIGIDKKKGVRGGIGRRKNPEDRITNFFGVESLEESIEKVRKAGGLILNPKQPVPGGHMALCLDTEGNAFGLWQEDKKSA